MEEINNINNKEFINENLIKEIEERTIKIGVEVKSLYQQLSMKMEKVIHL